MRDAVADAKKKDRSPAARTLELLAPRVAAATTRAREHLATFPEVPMPDDAMPPEVVEWMETGEELVAGARRSLRVWLGLAPD